MTYPNTSGSLVRGNLSGRFAPQGVGMHGTGHLQPVIRGNNSLLEDSSVLAGGLLGYISASYSNIRRATYGYLEGVGYIGGMATMDGEGDTTRHMQVGVGKNSTEGSNTPPCLQLDTYGMWRFRWVVKGPTRTVSVLTKQNSTGSQRPSMVVKANPLIGVPYDISASAANNNSWTIIGPLSVIPTGTGSLWVELHNNRTEYPFIGNIDTDNLYPALFDHIVTT